MPFFEKAFSSLFHRANLSIFRKQTAFSRKIAIFAFLK
jgi:hypothetical protein